MSEERDKLLDEVNELLQLQNELNDELRTLRGDAPPTTPSKGLLGGRGSANSAHLQEVYAQIDELEEEVRTRSTETEMLRRQLQEMEEEKAAAQLAHEAELTDMQRQRDENGQEVGWAGIFAVGCVGENMLCVGGFAGSTFFLTQMRAHLARYPPSCLAVGLIRSMSSWATFSN